MSEASEPERIKSTLFHYREIPPAEQKPTGPAFGDMKVKAYGLMTYGSIANMVKKMLAEEEAANQIAGPGLAATIIQHSSDESMAAAIDECLHEDPERRKSMSPTREEMAQLQRDIESLLERLDQKGQGRPGLGEQGA